MRQFHTLQGSNSVDSYVFEVKMVKRAKLKIVILINLTLNIINNIELLTTEILVSKF